jgi:hypothetical protein
MLDLARGRAGRFRRAELAACAARLPQMLDAIRLRDECNVDKVRIRADEHQRANPGNEPDRELGPDRQGAHGCHGLPPRKLTT